MGYTTKKVYLSVLTDDDRFYLPPSHWLRAFSIGYNETAADFVWVKTIVYFGGSSLSTKQKEQVGHTHNYLATAADLDPRFRRLYTTGSSITLFEKGGSVTEQTVKKAIELLERGIEEFPNDGEMAFHLGFTHYYEMRPFLRDDPQDPKRRYHRETGVKYIGRSAMMEGSPPYATRLSATLYSKEGFDELMVDHLKAMLLKETDEKIRGRLIRQLRRELGKAAERDIAVSRRIHAEWKENMPFVPYDFYLLLTTEMTVEEMLDPLVNTNRILGLND